MYLKLKEGKQTSLIKSSIKKAGSYRKLAKLIKIPRASLLDYSNGRIIPKERFELLAKFLKINNSNDLILEILPDNWKQVRGGEKCVIIKKEKGTFEKDLKKAQKAQSKKLKKWHKFMKKNKPEEYYNIQFSRFKKMLGYKLLTKRGEKVRNILEKQIADILLKLKIDYQYEPLVRIENNYFFPDFVIDNKIIIECTAWKGVEKAYKLKRKIEILSKKYKVFVVIPKALYRYYQILNQNLIKGLEEFVLVAQTFLDKTS